MEQEILEKLHKTELEILDEVVRICKKHDINYFLSFGTLLGAVRHKGFIPWDDDIDIGMIRKDFEKFRKVCKKELGDRFIFDHYSTNKKHYQNICKIRLKNTAFLESTDEKVEKSHGIWIDIFLFDNVRKENSFSQKFKWKLAKYTETLMTIKCGMSYYKSGTKRKVLEIILKLVPARLLTGFYTCLVSLNKNSNTKYICNFGNGPDMNKVTFLYKEFFPLVELEFEGKMHLCPANYMGILNQIYGDKCMEIPPKEKWVTHKPLFIKFEDGEERSYERE